MECGWGLGGRVSRGPYTQVCIQCVCVCVRERESPSRVRLFTTPWTIAHQALLSLGFSRQEYWSGLLFPSPGDLPDPEIEPRFDHYKQILCKQILYRLSHVSFCICIHNFFLYIYMFVYLRILEQCEYVKIIFNVLFYQ